MFYSHDQVEHHICDASGQNGTVLFENGYPRVLGGIEIGLSDLDRQH